MKHYHPKRKHFLGKQIKILQILLRMHNNIEIGKQEIFKSSTSYYIPKFNRKQVSGFAKMNRT